MSNYKATPEQWKQLEEWSRYPSSSVSCILELRDRVQALESQAGNYQGILDGSTPPSVATDEKLWSLWANRPSGPLSAPAALRAIYNLGIEHGQARSRDVAEPAPVAGGLVERVAKRLVAVFENGPYTIEACKWDESAARAAILEVAAWMRENECGYNAVRWLEQEAGR